MNAQRVTMPGLASYHSTQSEAQRIAEWAKANGFTKAEARLCVYGNWTITCIDANGKSGILCTDLRVREPANELPR
jgi:hypothetical protein